MNAKRRAIYDKSNGHCWYCGCKLDEKGWHADHFEPIRRNWWTNTSLHPERDSEENRVPACASCNIQKGSLSLEAFRDKIQNFPMSLQRYHTQYSVAKRYGLIKETDKEVKFWFEQNNIA